MTATSDRIRDVHFPKWLSLFEKKSREYGEKTHEDLGVRGQFSDIYRKVVKLKKFMWDEPESVPAFESLEEIIYDLIGHLFLTIDMMKWTAEREVPLYVGPAEVEARELLEQCWQAMQGLGEDGPGGSVVRDERTLGKINHILQDAHIKKIVGSR
jgi:hypothetical protein